MTIRILPLATCTLQGAQISADNQECWTQLTLGGSLPVPFQTHHRKHVTSATSTRDRHTSITAHTKTYLFSPLGWPSPGRNMLNEPKNIISWPLEGLKWWPHLPSLLVAIIKLALDYIYLYREDVGVQELLAGLFGQDARDDNEGCVETVWMWAVGLLFGRGWEGSNLSCGSEWSGCVHFFRGVRDGIRVKLPARWQRQVDLWC